MDHNIALIKLGVSLALGTAIGLERELSDKSAGLRTNILICLGATLYTMLSQYFTNDPARIAAQIVSGIGFLGAGAIMREGDRVTGLTTAATIWTVAAIGTAVGFGHFRIAALFALAVLIVELVFYQLDIWIDDLRERHNYRVITKIDETCIAEIERIFRESRVKVMRRKLMKKEGYFYSEWFTAGPRASNEKAVKLLIVAKDILEVTY